MTRSIVGLDLDPFQARAAEVRVDRRSGPRLDRVARLELPHGAIRGGAVADPDRLGDALRSWWSTERFATRSVVVGLASAEVRVAVIEEPLMTSEELDTVLRDAAPAALGVSLDDHVIDYQVIERVIADGGDAVLRTLLVGAPRTTVDPLLAALDRARLRPELVDLHAFALLRALVQSSGDAPGAGDALGADDAPPVREGLVSIGGGGAVVVVHDSGAPRRIAVVGPELGPDDGEDGGPTEQWLGLATAAVADGVRLANSDEPPSRIRLAGSPPVVGSLLPRLQAELAQQVDAADPVAVLADDALRIDAGRVDLGDRPSLSIALGLALAGREVSEGAHRLNLLPPAAPGPAIGRHAVLAGAVVLATVAGLGALWLGRADEADRTETEADRLESELADLGAVVTDLAAVDDLATEVGERAALVGLVLEGDVAWTKLIQEIATVQPDDVWLRSFTARAPQAGDGSGFTVSGRGTDHTSAARWLTRLQGLPTVEDVWVSRSQRAADEELNRFGEIEFDSSGELTDAALSDRVDLYVPPDPRVLGTEPGSAADGTEPESGGSDGGEP